MGGTPYPSGGWLTYGKPATYKIYLLTMPTSMFSNFGIKKPLDMVAHWALLIDGRCYQLGHTGIKGKPYGYQWKWEPHFVEHRNKQGKPIEYMEVGYMATSYSHEWVDKANVCSTGSAEVILPSILDSTEKIAILKHQTPTELLRYFRNELDVSKVNHTKNHLWLAGQHRSCRPLHMQKVLGREIVVVEICHLHLTWRDATIFIKPCPDFLLDYSIWKTYLSTEEELYRNALGFLITYTSLVRRKSDLKVAHELGLLPATLGWARWNQLSRLIVGAPFDQFVRKKTGRAEQKIKCTIAGAMGSFDSDDSTGSIAYASAASASVVNSKEVSSISIRITDFSSTGTLPGLRFQQYT